MVCLERKKIFSILNPNICFLYLCKFIKFQLLSLFVLSVCTNQALALICYRCKSSDLSLNGTCGQMLSNPVPSTIKACISNGTCVTFQNTYDNNGLNN